jgi:hypothetical protein
MAAAIVAGYGKGRDEASVRVRLQKNGDERFLDIAPMSQDRCTLLQVV